MESNHFNALHDFLASSGKSYFVLRNSIRAFNIDHEQLLSMNRPAYGILFIFQVDIHRKLIKTKNVRMMKERLRQKNNLSIRPVNRPASIIRENKPISRFQLLVTNSNNKSFRDIDKTSGLSLKNSSFTYEGSRKRDKITKYIRKAQIHLWTPELLVPKEVDKKCEKSKVKSICVKRKPRKEEFKSRFTVKDIKQIKLSKLIDNVLDHYDNKAKEQSLKLLKMPSYVIYRPNAIKNFNMKRVSLNNKE